MGRDAEPETIEWLNAFRAAQRAISPLHCVLQIAGTRPGRTENFCGVPHDQITILTNGSVLGCCSSPVRSCPADEAFREVYSARMAAIEDRPYCQGCFARRECAGPCYFDAGGASAAKEFRGSQRCHLVRELLKDRLLAHIARSGGISWRYSLGQEEHSDD
ncbi:MAG: hypothetical protein IPG76_00100 [Acidobacteria bacterium]|nr:hypothetical protein [Acidobacteriota bacterium]